MKTRSVLDWVGIAVGWAVACSSASDKSDGGTGPGADSGNVVTWLTDGGGEYKGGMVPMPDGGLAELQDAACTGWSAEPEPPEVVLEFVVDDSNSMNDPAPGSNRSKWEETRDALVAAIGTLPASSGVGMMLFPNMATGSRRNAVDSSQCVNTNAFIPIALLGGAGSAQRTAIDQVLTTNRPNSRAGTPTDDAYRLALAEMAETNLPGNRFIVLITDGQPTYNFGCVGTGSADQRLDPQPVIDDIGRAYSQQSLRTFVIGSPGSEYASETGQDFRPSLSRAAAAGGTATLNCNDNGPNYCHFDMTQAPNFGEALRAALTEIAGIVVQCQYTVPAPPPDQQINPNAVNVVYTTGSGEQYLVLRSSADPCAEGWNYSADQTQIRLCDDTCALVKADAGARLNLLIGCATRTGPVF